MVLLVVASPCAVVVGSPAVVLSAIARAARHGVLFKGGYHLELLGRVEVMALDKTGTITVGKPSVSTVWSSDVAAVFLAGSHVYKVKKPVEFGFLDFSTLAKRKHFCEEEVRLNRRLASEVYLGVVPVTRSAKGLRVEGDGDVVEWAVKMRRLPDDATLQNRLPRGEVGVQVMESLARKIAAFHAQAESGPAVAAFGRFGVVAGNIWENYEQSVAHLGTTVSNAVFARARALTEEALAHHRALIESRAELARCRQGHRGATS